MATNKPTEPAEGTGAAKLETAAPVSPPGLDKALEQFPEGERERAKQMLETILSYRKALSMVGIRADESAIVMLAAAHQG